MHRPIVAHAELVRDRIETQRDLGPRPAQQQRAAQHGALEQRTVHDDLDRVRTEVGAGLAPEAHRQPGGHALDPPPCPPALPQLPRLPAAAVAEGEPRRAAPHQQRELCREALRRGGRALRLA